MSTSPKQQKPSPRHIGTPEPDGSQVSVQMDRRDFIEMLGAGLLVSVAASPVLVQEAAAAAGGSRQLSLAARLHLDKEGNITVLVGKIDGGNGARTELTQAAAEELRLPPQALTLVMGDTDLVPDDGITAGSRTTPGTVPPVRRGAATLRELLVDFGCHSQNAPREAFEFREGKLVHKSSGKMFTYKDLANSPELEPALAKTIAPDIALTPVREWKVLGQPTERPNRAGFVTGAHKFPSDIVRPGMLYGKVLRAPAYGAKLVSIDLGPAEAMPGVVALREGEFVGVAAATSFLAAQALEAAAATAKWEEAPHPSSKEVFDFLRSHTERAIPENPFPSERASAKSVLRQTFRVPYVQHSPLEPRAAVAEWQDGKLTVWTGTQNPFGSRGELARALGVSQENVRVIVPDFGSGFGGKHTPDAGIEAARLAKAAGKPVSIRWTRQEEFTWAYFRPAALIEIEATLDAHGALTSWHYLNINSGGAAIETPYRCARNRCQYVPARTPMRQGSYRALAATANTFARECFMDELAAEAKSDPLAFRLAHLDNPRLKDVLETVAKRFEWAKCANLRTPQRGFGLACSTEKGSFVATCVEIELTGSPRRIVVRRVAEVFECGKILNPANLLSQVRGQIIMALGPALREEILFEHGQVLNGSFRKYGVPRFSDVPELDIHLLDRPELDSAGGGETPLIAVAPAIANAVFNATGVRVREMPIRL